LSSSYVWSPYELNWRGFLVDLDVSGVVSQLEGMRFKASLTTEREDPATVHEAWNGSQTVVTANEADFIRYTLEHQKRDSGQECNNAWGLLIMPNLAVKRERALAAIKRGVPVDSGTIIPWSAAAYANLCVSPHPDGTVGLRRFRRCIHCEKAFPIHDEWYTRLPELGSLKTR